ncbi:MAG TPA: ATP-dependent helicase [Candidatus Fraserbacteria bacterium]|nr:ATP-dependent helicase [Candidatus Fraserbacteria bacterium]
MIRTQENDCSDEELYRLLHPWVADWFRSSFQTFSPPQRGAIPLIQARQNCLISAPTGSGKTLSAFLAVLSELVSLSERGRLEERIYAIYISPLKALGNDIERNLNEPLRAITRLAGRELGIRLAVRTGDSTAYQKQRMLHNPPHILITTPESLAISLTAKGFSRHLTQVQWVIVDEIHALAENKRGTHLALSLERLQELGDFTRVGLSATINPLEEVAKFLVGRRWGRELAEVAPAGADPWRDCWIVDRRFDKQLDLQVLSPVTDFIRASAEQLSGNLYGLLHRLIAAHRTTLIFTNTRSGTERVVHFLKEHYPRYTKLIGAHHGSLSKELRQQIEGQLKEGKLRVVVCSTSLELGIDIGYIDLVILLGSPKSVTRALQRVGRSGHKLHDRVMGRILVTGRDDLVECAVMLKCAMEHQLDRLHIPTNALDVLAQQIFGLLMDRRYYLEDLWELVTRAYPYTTLDYADFERVLEYLAGEYSSLEDRWVYAKIYYDREQRLIGKRGRLARVIYMTNVGTIPDESYITVKVGERRIGQIEESFLERLRKGDIFVLGGSGYRFRYSRGMTVQVEPASGRSPTVPSWYSEMLPLSFGLALEIQGFRAQLSQMFARGEPGEVIRKFIKNYLYLDRQGVESLWRYFAEQQRYAQIPHRHKILIEYYQEELHPELWRSPIKTWVIFHTLFGRRVNDALSRALAWLIARREDQDVEIGITDHGFYLAYEGQIKVMEAFELLKDRPLREVLRDALADSEILKRRFRHCATRSLMILRNYKGRHKSVGRQQMKSLILQSLVLRMDEYFPVLQEAYREVLEDAMDIENAERVLAEIRAGVIEIQGQVSATPSPFAFHIVMQGRSDLVKAEDRQAFLLRMYRQLLEQKAEASGAR